MAAWRLCQLLLRAVPRAAAFPRTVYLSRPCFRAMSSGGGGVPTDEQQATGLERKVLQGLKKGEVKKTILKSFGSGSMKGKYTAVRSVALITSLCLMSFHTDEDDL